jgi:hypothetical protein
VKDEAVDISIEEHDVDVEGKEAVWLEMPLSWSSSCYKVVLYKL